MDSPTVRYPDYAVVNVELGPQGAVVIDHTFDNKVELFCPRRRWRWRSRRRPRTECVRGGTFWDPLRNPRDYDEDYESTDYDEPPPSPQPPPSSNHGEEAANHLNDNLDASMRSEPESEARPGNAEALSLDETGVLKYVILFNITYCKSQHLLKIFSSVYICLKSLKAR